MAALIATPGILLPVLVSKLTELGSGSPSVSMQLGGAEKTPSLRFTTVASGELKFPITQMPVAESAATPSGSAFSRLRLRSENSQAVLVERSSAFKLGVMASALSRDV